MQGGKGVVSSRQQECTTRAPSAAEAREEFEAKSLVNRRGEADRVGVLVQAEQCLDLQHPAKNTAANLAHEESAADPRGWTKVA